LGIYQLLPIGFRAYTLRDGEGRHPGNGTM